MTKNTLRIGFIGGAISSAVGTTHAVACQLDNRWQLVSGCFSRNETQSRETAEKWGLPLDKAYTDWKLYIEQEKEHLDAIAVLTPTPTHEKIVCALLDAGIAVICEKAMAANLSESANIKRALDRSNGFLAVTFNYSGYPMLRVLRRHIESGTLGKLKQIQIEMPTDGFIQEKDKMSPQPWRLVDGEIPTILLDLAVHLHHIVDFTTQLKPLSVNADFHHFSIFEGIIDDAYIWANYEKDLRVSYWVSKTALGYRNGMKVRIFGEEGSAEWYQEEPEKLHFFSKSSVHTTYDRANCLFPEEIRQHFKAGHPSGFIEAFANLYADIADSYCHFKTMEQISSDYIFGWEQADNGLKLLTAAVKSNAKGKWTNVS